MHRHVVVVMPHPDDESLACGGTIALHTTAGTPVTYVCGTLGEMGRNMGKPAFATRESLPALRERELREACAALGIKDLRLLGIRDKTMEFIDPVELAARIGMIIAELNPSLVITYHPQHSVHPDHMAMGAATVRALAAMDPERRPELHVKAFGKGVEEALGKPDNVLDITSVIDKKFAAIRAHRSQTQGMIARNAAKMAKDDAFRKQMEQQQTKEGYWIYRF